MLMTGEEIIKKFPLSSDDEIRQHLSGNLCRCTGYQNIVTAVREAAKQMRAKPAVEGHSDGGAENQEEIQDAPTNRLRRKAPAPASHKDLPRQEAEKERQRERNDHDGDGEVVSLIPASARLYE